MYAGLKLDEFKTTNASVKHFSRNPLLAVKLGFPENELLQ